MRFLLDEMFPAAAAQRLRSGGHTANHVSELGLAGAPDVEVAAHARDQRRVLVTENVADFAGCADLVVAFVRKRNLPAGGAQAAALAALLTRWASDDPRPYIGPHWPTDRESS